MLGCVKLEHQTIAKHSMYFIITIKNKTMPDTNKLIRSLILIFLVCGALYFAKTFLVPIAF